MSEKRTLRKSESNKAVRKMISIKADSCTKNVEMLWQMRKNNENNDF